jgi:hypothetical protein
LIDYKSYSTILQALIGNSFASIRFGLVPKGELPEGSNLLQEGSPNRSIIKHPFNWFGRLGISFVVELREIAGLKSKRLTRKNKHVVLVLVLAAILLLEALPRPSPAVNLLQLLTKAGIY